MGFSSQQQPQAKKIKLEQQHHSELQDAFDFQPFHFINSPNPGAQRRMSLLAFLGDHEILNSATKAANSYTPIGLDSRGVIDLQQQTHRFSLPFAMEPQQSVKAAAAPSMANKVAAPIQSFRPFEDCPQEVSIGASSSISEQQQLPNNASSLDQQEDNISKGGSVRFRSHQAENWTEKYEELLDYRLKNGHCLVPNAYPDKSLPEWVKRQRYQYKLKRLGKHSTMSDDRILALEKIGFVWNSHDAAWEERLKELVEYKRTFGDCNVPSNYTTNPQLAVWVKRQRRQYKFLQQGEVSTMTPPRVEKLLALGFAWSGRKGSK